MNEQIAIVLVAVITAVIGPAVVTWIGKVSKRTAKLQTTHEPEPELDNRLLMDRIITLNSSLQLLHQKVDLLQEGRMLQLLNKLDKEH